MSFIIIDLIRGPFYLFASRSSDIYGELAYLYHQTHFRAFPWIVGMMLGVFAARNKQINIPEVSSFSQKVFRTIKNSFYKLQKISIVMWILTALTTVAVFFPRALSFLLINRQIMASFYKLWTFAIAWIILACHYDRSSKLNKFLSHSTWMPVEKIGLSLYLVHVFVIANFLISRKHPIDFDLDMMVSNFALID